MNNFALGFGGFKMIKIINKTFPFLSSIIG